MTEKYTDKKATPEITTWILCIKVSCLGLRFKPFSNLVANSILQYFMKYLRPMKFRGQISLCGLVHRILLPRA